MKWMRWIEAILLAVFAAASAAAQDGKIPRDQIAKSLELPLQLSGATGMIVAVVKGDNAEVFALGFTDTEKKTKVDSRSLWAIGSISKVVTCQVLGRFVVDGSVNLTDAINTYLPNGPKLPEYDGRQITFLDAATHTAGYPRGLLTEEEEMKYLPKENKDFTWDETLAWMAKYKLKERPGTKYDYSNIGFGLIGNALALIKGKTFEELLLETYGPAGLKDITTKPSDEQLARKPASYWMDGREIKPDWVFDFEKPSGGIYMTGDDMAAFLRMILNRRDNVLEKTNDITHATYRYTSELVNGRSLPFMGMALGWHVDAPTSTMPLLLWKDGWVSGFTSYVAIAPGENIGVMAVTNRPYPGLSEMSKSIIGALRP